MRGPSKVSLRSRFPRSFHQELVSLEPAPWWSDSEIADCPAVQREVVWRQCWSCSVRVPRQAPPRQLKFSFLLTGHNKDWEVSFLLENLRENFSLFPASEGSLCSLACGPFFTFPGSITKSLFFHFHSHSYFSLWLWFSCLPGQKTYVIILGPTGSFRIILYFKILNLITFSVTFICQVHTGFQKLGCGHFWGPLLNLL